jgi:hypothetical protein
MKSEIDMKEEDSATGTQGSGQTREVEEMKFCEKKDFAYGGTLAGWRVLLVWTCGCIYKGGV